MPRGKPQTGRKRAHRAIHSVEGFALGKWKNRQIRLHAMKNTGDPFIDEERMRLLEAIPGWQWEDGAVEWREGYAQSVQYGCVAESFVTSNGFELGKWQAAQRKHCPYTGRRKWLEQFVKGWKW